MPGQLFTDYYVTEGIRDTDEWKHSVSSPGAFEAFSSGLRERYESFTGYSQPNEAVTEHDLIEHLLRLLGWRDYLPQQGSTRNEDIPDLLLFPDAGAKERAVAREVADQRYLDAVAVGESKRLGLALDARDGGQQASRTPHGQILRYLSTAEIESEGRIRWGILTSGDVWRLYHSRARPRSTGYLEVDLAAVLENGDVDALRVFHLLFRRESFVLREGATTTFLQAALDEGNRYEERVAADLSGTVFETVFPRLVAALADEHDGELPEVREAALIFLYRLLFILFAEDRGLLPVHDAGYNEYGLREEVRQDIAERMQDGTVFSSVSARYYDHVMTLCGQIDKGDPPIGLPPYNGGLFAREAAPMLSTARLPDSIIAPLIYDLSHAESEGGRRFINYRDMSVQQLGSIYERLLEREPVRNEDGHIEVRPNPYARKDSGSFFTPQELVDLIIDRTLKPLVEERLSAFENRARELANESRPAAERRDELLGLDPAEAVLDLKVLDPAMGSGHFLVSTVDFISDYIADLIEYAPAVPDWLNGEYVSPLVERVDRIRQEIVTRAHVSGWAIDEGQLTDQAIIRRMVLKRCIYGVDKNPLTVELAKVSLWLHSFTVGAPLSFLDHHLRCGDSLAGMSVTEATAELGRLGGLFASSAIGQAEEAASEMQQIEDMSDADISEVQEAASLFRDVEDKTSDVRGLLDFLCGLRWLTAGKKKKERTQFESPLVQTLGSRPDDAYELLARGMFGPGQDSGFSKIWNDARAIADRERFLHWQVAFPGVWQGWQQESPQGGFDAVIGNPPWEKIKLQEVEWFASRRPDLALTPTAAARRRGIRQLRAAGDPLVDDFDDAKDRADRMSRLFRDSGQYPLLGRGDINLYSLFVERAMGLANPSGFVGLLTQSGIYADKTAAQFFKVVSTGGRLSGIYDFENRKIFFKDVHSSQKFCALIFGGEERRFDETECAFFLHDTESIRDPERCFSLTPEDFARVNPNTGTAPVFRTRMDAVITRGIYERHRVLVDRSGQKENALWPVRYRRMFDMSNDSDLFKTSEQLESNGFYPVQGNRWRKGDELYLPMYEGKMVQAFDHRAASVIVNPNNLYRSGQTEEATLEQHQNHEWLPSIRHFINHADMRDDLSRDYAITYKRITAPTNVRTMIAAIGPFTAYETNANNILLPIGADVGAHCQIAANLNSTALDYVVRQKIQGITLNWYIVEQMPFIAPDDYDRKFGDMTANELVRDHVLRLTYTAYDMRPFAQDLEYDGEPFTWDVEERRHLRARLDALYFHLYGLSREDAGYVMETFPIVKRRDEAEFDGKYRTREMVLAYMDALSAGDVKTKVSV